MQLVCGNQRTSVTTLGIVPLNLTKHGEVACEGNRQRKGSTMSSDEMRVDLESFVNQGIAEGRQGWPLKGSLQCRHEGIRRVCRASRVTGPCRRFLGVAFGEDGHSNRFSDGRLGDFLR